jgi:3-dehydroquinate dehydratase/shikimate dehydrogenase
MIKASLIASLMTPPTPDGEELRTLPVGVDWLEVREDLVGEISTDWLRDRFRGQLLFASRSRTEGGRCTSSPGARSQRLQTAAREYDRVELEADRDLSSSLLSHVPVGKRCVSWHGPACDLSSLTERFARLSSVPAAAYKLNTQSSCVADDFVPLSLLKSLNRADTIAYSEGALGFWNRIAALQWGAPAIYGQVDSVPVSPWEPSMQKLTEDYGLPEVLPVKALYAIIGDPIFHSLSPRLHNASYRATNYPALFVPLRVTDFSEFWRDVVCSKVLDGFGFPLQGMTVASPHKEAALLTAKLVSPMAQRAESANILVRNNGSWNADTTDPQVVYLADRERSVQIKNKRAAVIGCGGAGRAIAAALVQSGAGVTLVNRGTERGQYAAELLGLPYLSLPDFDADGYDIVVNATPVGRDTDEVPFNPQSLSAHALVIDLVYRSRPTSLVDSTVGRDQCVIDGRDVLVTQVRQQFQMMTGREMSPDVALEALGLRSAEASTTLPLEAGAILSAVQS